MSQTHPPSEGDEDIDLAAAEYVVGLTGAEARASAKVRLDRDPAFAAAVEAWDLRLSPLLDEVTPVTPPDGLWPRIEAAVAPGATVVSLAARQRPWDRVGVWRMATAACLMAASLAVVAVFQWRSAPAPAAAIAPPAIQVATLVSSAGKPLYVATVDVGRREATLVPVRAVDSAGRVPELWLIPPGGKPLAIGLIAAARPARVGMTAATAPTAGAVLAVSLEPPGGSTTGGPTGPVIATGALTSL